MLAQGAVGLDLLKLVAGDDAQGVLLSINSALLQAGEQLAERHGGGVGAHGLPGLQVDLIGHGADLQTAQVSHRGDVLLGGGDVAEAILPEGQALQAILREAVQDGLTSLTVEAHIIDLLLVQEHIGNVIDIQVVIGGSYGRGGTHRDVTLAGLSHGKGLLVIAQLVIREVGDLDGTVGVLLHLGDQDLSHSVLGAGGGHIAHDQLHYFAPVAGSRAAALSAVLGSAGSQRSHRSTRQQHR